eukprot:829899-Rhodomonas_salina.5
MSVTELTSQHVSHPSTHPRACGVGCSGCWESDAARGCGGTESGVSVLEVLRCVGVLRATSRTSRGPLTGPQRGLRRGCRELQSAALEREGLSRALGAHSCFYAIKNRTPRTLVQECCTLVYPGTPARAGFELHPTGMSYGPGCTSTIPGYPGNVVSYNKASFCYNKDYWGPLFSTVRGRTPSTGSTIRSFIRRSVNWSYWMANPTEDNLQAALRGSQLMPMRLRRWPWVEVSVQEERNTSILGVSEPCLLAVCCPGVLGDGAEDAHHEAMTADYVSWCPRGHRFRRSSSVRIP